MFHRRPASAFQPGEGGKTGRKWRLANGRAQDKRKRDIRPSFSGLRSAETPLSGNGLLYVDHELPHRSSRYRPLRAYPNNWRKRACPLGDAKLGLRLDWGNDQSERPQGASYEACWACHQDQSHHRRVPDLRRAVGSAGAPDPRACEHPSVRRGPAAGSRPYCANGICTCCAPAASGKPWTPPASAPGPPPICAFRNGLPLGCFWSCGGWDWNAMTN